MELDRRLDCLAESPEEGIENSEESLDRGGLFRYFLCMIKALAEVTREAMALPEDQRLSLVRTILGSTDACAEPDDGVDQAWEDEIAARIRAIDSGATQGRSWDDVLKDIDSRLAS